MTLAELKTREDTGGDE